MILQLPELLNPETLPFFQGMKDEPPFQVLVAKVNELVAASNRQDRVLAQLIHNMPGGMEQHLKYQDYEVTMESYEADDAG